MSTRIGLFSDPHAAAAPVREALELFGRKGVDRIYCAGDIAGYGDELEATLDLIKGGQVEAIHGNHDLSYLEHPPDSDPPRLADTLRRLPAVIDTRIEACKLYLVHASPPDNCHGGLKLLDENGRLLGGRKTEWSRRIRDLEADILIVGHTHQVFAERLGHVLVINPGSTLFNHSCAILDLPQGEVEFFPLSGKAILRSWNWGSGPLPGTARDRYPHR